MEFPLDRFTVEDGMVFDSFYNSGWHGLLGRFTVVDGMALGSFCSSGWHGLWIVLH
jgi:hypothetical protein